MPEKLVEISGQHRRNSFAQIGDMGNQVRLLARDPLIWFVMAFAAAALVLFPKYFSGLVLYYGGSFVVVVPILTLFIVIGRAIVLSPAEPFTGFMAMIIRLPARLYVTTVLAILFSAAFTTFKINIPQLVPFYADPSIARLDAWIHGTDPWRLARAMPALTSLVVDFFYSRAWFAVTMICVIYVTLAGSAAEFRRFMMAAVVIYVALGVLGATAFSSVGPVFYDHFYPGARFAELTAILNADAYAMGERNLVNYLYDAFTSKTVAIGSGISAMPSIHVGIAVMNAWYATSQGRAWAIAGWTFALIILFGSIYTGWHYAADGYLSAILVSVIWLALSRYYRLPLTKSRKPVELQ